MRKVPPISRYSATIRPWAVASWYSPTNLYVPALSAGTFTFTVLPPAITFSIFRSLLSNSSADLSLLVMTSTNGAPAFTLISAGSKRFFSMVSGISGSSAPAGTGARARPVRSRTAASVATSAFMILGSPLSRTSGLPKSRPPVNARRPSGRESGARSEPQQGLEVPPEDALFLLGGDGGKPLEPGHRRGMPGHEGPVAAQHDAVRPDLIEQEAERRLVPHHAVVVETALIGAGRLGNALGPLETRLPGAIQPAHRVAGGPAPVRHADLD